MGSASDLRPRGRGFFDSWLRRCCSTTLGKLFTPLVSLSPSSIISQWFVMLCGWEGNRRLDIALAMRYRHRWFIHRWAKGKRDNYRAYVSVKTKEKLSNPVLYFTTQFG